MASAYGGGLPSLGANRRSRQPEANWPRSQNQGPNRSSRNLGKSPSPLATAELMFAQSNGSTGAMAMDTAEGLELIRIGIWSVRRTAGGGLDGGLVYVNTETGEMLADPPQDVLADLGMDGEEEVGPRIPSTSPEGMSMNGGSRPSTSGGSRSRPGTSSRSRPGTAQGRPDSGAQQSGSASSRAETQDPEEARFLRIVLGKRNEMALSMARDILAAINEDIGIFDAVKTRYSDKPDETSVELSGLPEELQQTASVYSLEVGQLSEVLGTDEGMQILLRIS